MFGTQLMPHVRHHVFFTFYINTSSVRRKFQCSQKEYGIQKHTLNDDQQYNFNCIKHTNSKHYQFTVAIYSITAKLSRPSAAQAHPYQGQLGQRWGLQSKGAFRNAYLTDPTEVLPTRISAVGTGYKTLGFSI